MFYHKNKKALKVLTFKAFLNTLVASSGIEPESGASEALILSIVLRGRRLFSEMAHVAAEYFYRYGQQYYAEKFSYDCHSIRT